MSPTLNAPISAGKVDVALFDRAVIDESNRMRARHGVAPLEADRRLARAAFLHAQNMARLRTLSHSLPVAGQASLAQRLGSAAISYRRAAENIGTEKVYRITEAPISTEVNGCTFFHAGSGTPVPIHSYGSLANRAVSQWMASPPHRANLLNPDFRRIGTAFAIDPTGPACGDIYLAQVFAD